MSDDTQIYEIDVELRQSAIVAVEAKSREEAWQALKMSQDRNVQRELTKTEFSGDMYKPIDAIAVNDVDEPDISLVENKEGE